MLMQRGSDELLNCQSFGGGKMQRAVRSLVDDAIRELIAAVVAGKEIVRAGAEARRLADTYPGSGLTPREIMDAVVKAASAAGLAVELELSVEGVQHT